MEYPSKRFIDEAVSIITASRIPVVSTGAGMSKESGVRTFRGDDGYWREHRAEDLASPEAIRNTPKLVWEWYGERLKACEELKPHPGYEALLKLSRLKGGIPVITQNVDGLLQKAGFTDVIELHGNLRTASCFDDCGAPKVPMTRKLFRDPPPRCRCGGLLRPDVVLFGEALPEKEMKRAFDLAERCDLMMVIGTSMVVYPASALPIMVLKRGLPIIEINPDMTDLTGLPGVTTLHGPAGQVLTEIAERF